MPGPDSPRSGRRRWPIPIFVIAMLGAAERLPAQQTPAPIASPPSASLPDVPASEVRLPPGPVGAFERVVPLPLPGFGERSVGAPGTPPPRGRPMPGGALDPGAAGPGIGRTTDEDFLGGAFDHRTGWPFVFLDHFQPRMDRVDRIWHVHTRDCPQEMGTDPWPRLKVQQFDAQGNIVERSPAELFAQCVGHPIVIQVHGNQVTPDESIGELLWSHSWLGHNRVLPPDAVLIEFDWPSQRIYRNDNQDINEKARRSYVAGFHLARFVQSLPASSRVAFLSQSYGGRVVLSALHLLGGGALNSGEHDPQVRLASCRPDLHLRAILLEGASDHDAITPEKRLERALPASEALLNLYNRRDEALRLYPFLKNSDHRRAIGRLGLTNRDFDRLGPLAARYEEHDIHDILGGEHSLLDAVSNRQITRWMAPYLWSPDPGPSPEPTYSNTPRGRMLGSTRFNFGRRGR